MTTLQQIYMNQLQKEVSINENFYAVSVAATFSNKGNHQGLDFNYYGGKYQKLDGTQGELADGTITLNDYSDNYVYFDLINGIMAVDTVAVPDGLFPIAKVITANGKITSIEDIRVMPLFAVGTPGNLIYVLPIATENVLGGVKVDNTTILIDQDGVISLGVVPVPIDDSITDGITDRAPSQNAVYQALLLKADVGHTHTAADITDFDTTAQSLIDTTANTLRSEFGTEIDNEILRATGVEADLQNQLNNHNHDTQYLGITAKAVDSDLLDGFDSDVNATPDTVVVRDSSGNINANGVNTKTTDFDILADELNAVGRLRWNDTDGTLDLGLKGGNVVLQLGQEQVQMATNITGSTITNGSAVYITGASGNRLTITKAIANTESTSSKTFGIATEDINNNESGFITTSGLVRDIDTSAFAEGSALWLSDTVEGGFTDVRPTQPSHSVLIGWVVRSHATVGSIFVNIANGWELEELHNVLISNLQDGETLFFDLASGLWKNRAIIIDDITGLASGEDTFMIITAQTTTTTNEHYGYKLNYTTPVEATFNIEGIRTTMTGGASAVPYTTTGVSHYRAHLFTAGTNQTITNQYGFYASASLSSAQNNYGFYGYLNSVAGRWNFYAAGTAPNYMAGDIRTNTTYTKNSSITNTNLSATATASSLIGGVRTGTPTANVTLTLPTGTNMDSVFQELQTNHSFEWSYINLAATNTCTITANTDHTVVGNMLVAGNTSARFLTRKTAANTFITYRIA